MAQFITPQVEYSLNIKGEYHNTLDIEGFSQMMKDPSYWTSRTFAAMLLLTISTLLGTCVEIPS